MLDDGRTDRSAGLYYNQYDRVRIEKTWKQYLNKEADHREECGGLQANFQMNLANMSGTSGLLRLGHSHNRIEIVTEKEHKQTPNDRRSLKGMDPMSMEVLNIKHLQKTPSHKWDLPEASSHDYGWMQGDFVRHATMSPAKTASGNFFGANGKAAVANRGASSTGTGALALGAANSSASLASTASSVPSKMSISIVANDHILRRVQTAPHLPVGPRPQEAKNLNNVKWRRPQRSTDVTAYAEVYSSLLKHNPFNQAATGR